MGLGVEREPVMLRQRLENAPEEHQDHPSDDQYEAQCKQTQDTAETAWSDEIGV